jgi:PAS domain S-box-containing protein/putative nucleotidyltransferase with HDIG domain
MMKSLSQKTKDVVTDEPSPPKQINLWDRLVEPTTSILEPERRRRTRLLSALLATLVLLGLLSAVLAVFTGSNSSSLYINLGSALILAIAYYLSRTRYDKLAALLMVVALAGSVFAVQTVNSDPSPLYFLVLSVLISSLFLQRRETILITAGILLGIGLLWAFFPALPARNVLSAMFAVFCVGALGIVATTIRQQDLGQIQEQARLLVEDIAKREQVEKSLRESEQRFRALVENSMEEISMVDAQGMLIYESPSQRRPLGYPPGSFIGRSLFELFHPEDRAAADQLLAQVIAEPGSNREAMLRLRHQDGSWRWMEGIITNLLDEPAVRALVINYRDVTQRQQVQEALKVSQRLAEELYEFAPDGLVTVNTEGRITRINSRAQELFGYGNEELLNQPIEMLIPKHLHTKHEREREKFFTAPRKRGIVTGLKLSALRKDGNEFPVEIELSPLQIDGETFVTAAIRDISERLQTEKALRESEEKYRTLVEKMNEGVIVVDNNDVIQFVNNRFTQIVGYSREELLGSVAYNLFVHEEDQHIVQEKNNIRLEQKSDEYELRMKTKSGETIWVRINGTPILDAQGNVTGSIGINTDITQHKQVEEELKRRLSDFEAVNKLSTAMRQAQNLDELLDTVLNVTLEMLHATAGSLWLYHKTQNELRPMVIRRYNQQENMAPPPPEKPGEGIAGYVFATGQPFIAKDFHLSPRLPEELRRQIPAGIGGASIPIRAADKVIGTFNISIPQPRELTPNEIHLLITLSEIAGNAIQRTIFLQQTERRLQHLLALSEIDRAISSSFDLRISLGTLLNHVVTQLDIDAADVLLFDSNSLVLERIAEHGFRNKSRHIQPRLDKSYAGEAILERQMVKIENIKEQKNDEFLTMVGAQEAFVSYYAVPLMAKGYTKGVLEIFKRAPLEPDEEWLNFLNTLARAAAIAIDNATLFDGLQRSNAELSLAYDATIEGWSHALDLRDKETEGHTLRVTEMTMKLAHAFDLSNGELAQVRWGALLHDIGKMGVPDMILLKPGPLTDEEWVIMKKHPVFAYEMLSPIHYLHSALDIPYCHHEKWDGTGYPRGLKGEQIPLTARIFAVVDVWDALCSDRPYRPAWSKEKVNQHIKSLAGTHFDPQVVDCFLKMI